jgi:membrane-associated phospholipid phosphatase
MSNKLYVLIFALLILAVLGVAVTWHNPWLAAADAAALQTAIAARSPGLTTFMEGVTILGTWVVYLVVLLAGFVWWKQRPVQYLLIALASLTLAQFVRIALNFWIQRPRPPRADGLVPASFYAFPSGHTVLAGVGFGLAAWLIWLVDRRAGTIAAVVAAIFALMVALSRVYLGVHWASDVVGSLAFAVFWITITLIVARALTT